MQFSNPGDWIVQPKINSPPSATPPTDHSDQSDCMSGCPGHDGKQWSELRCGFDLKCVYISTLLWWHYDDTTMHFQSCLACQNDGKHATLRWHYDDTTMTLWWLYDGYMMAQWWHYDDTMMTLHDSTMILPCMFNRFWHAKTMGNVRRLVRRPWWCVCFIMFRCFVFVC